MGLVYHSIIKLTCYGLHTGRATFGKQLAKALGTVGLLIAAGEPLAS